MHVCMYVCDARCLAQCSNTLTTGMIVEQQKTWPGMWQWQKRQDSWECHDVHILSSVPLSIQAHKNYDNICMHGKVSRSSLVQPTVTSPKDIHTRKNASFVFTRYALFKCSTTGWDYKISCPQVNSWLFSIRILHINRQLFSCSYFLDLIVRDFNT